MDTASRETIIIEPKSRIASFETLGYHTTRAANGAIAGALFGKDKEKSLEFFKSLTNRKNKEFLSLLTSEIYSYLNSVLPDTADPADYFFRVWLRLEIDRKTGEIVSEPLFEADLFKYAGKLGGKYVEVGDYRLDVVFVGKEGTHITPFFVKAMNQVVNTTRLVKFKVYDNYRLAPKEVRQKITAESPFLIIDGKPFEIEMTMDSKRKVVAPLVESDGKKVSLESQESVANFLLREIKMKPEIRKSATIFQYADDEIEKIHDKIQQDSTETDEPDLLKSLDLLDFINSLDSRIQNINVSKLHEDQKTIHGTLVKQLSKSKDRFSQLSQEWECLREEIYETKKDMEKGSITYEQFSALRMRRFKALKNVEQELIGLQEEVKRDFVKNLNDFLENLDGKKREKI